MNVNFTRAVFQVVIARFNNFNVFALSSFMT